ncbi:uncharacterized protein LOC119017848 isoform X2 [Acanthopagrus latus]|uniref:uncharacterized protein LOC119017848 isoform X2 n=1 Tax=Acanthopagrus latus TaxID=8177 RepID=UPI00187CF780|nr:uncharacterized protein LOC119017848 isoform X2 [Acanthopagrus latus]
MIVMSQQFNDLLATTIISKYSDNQVIIHESVITVVTVSYCNVLNALCWFCLCNTQMAGRCWMAVTVCLLLFDGNSLADVDKNQLAPIVDEILNRYTPSYNGGRNPMFSLAVTIPYNKDTKMYDISQLDDGGRVRREILNCEVYTGTRVVAATVLRWPNVVDQCPGGRVQWPDVLRKCPGVNTWADVKSQCPNEVKEGRADHAEYRTLQHINTLVKNLDKNDLLLFYVLASPCDQRCTSESSNWSILNSIKAIQRWHNYAVVFSNIFQPRNGHVIPDQDLQGALQRLGGSIGLSNIFRCNRQRAMQCTSCSSGGQVARYCFSKNSQPSLTKPQQGVSTNVGSYRGAGPSGRGNIRKVGKHSWNTGM